ncbi:hypothetical protein L596_009618 [Steinernema carpocapsae]|uniref:Secreted protein n=1 Tax=Steinernema carpocapsae TaxID=34508 RepID=A0A4U5PFW6_STECR|nr:hypothetical protein L596_009618 [Steinernema carpocapsae]
MRHRISPFFVLLFAAAATSKEFCVSGDLCDRQYALSSEVPSRIPSTSVSCETPPERQRTNFCFYAFDVGNPSTEVEC